MKIDTFYTHEQCKIGQLTYSMRKPRKDCYDYCYRHGMFVKTCLSCGKQFHVKSRHTSTCSDKCRKAKSRKSGATSHQLKSVTRDV